MDKYTARLRRELVQNRELAAEISKVLSKYQLKVPEDKLVVWGPTVVDLPVTAVEIPIRIWDVGIPPEWELMELGYKVVDQFPVFR